VPQTGIVAVGLLTSEDLVRLGPTFQRAWPVEDTSCFSSLLLAIDEADREVRQGRTDSMKQTTLEFDDAQVTLASEAKYK
jgi:hypothetical protein